MWLVLCEDYDVVARWAYQGMLERHVAPLELITATQLADARRWVHRVSATSVDVEATLSDGRVLQGSEVRGALNRLITAWSQEFDRALPLDREYASQEFYAFFVSWLHGLHGTVLNRPGALGLSGQWRHESEWMVHAGRAGLPTRLYRMPETVEPASAHNGRGGVGQAIIVLGDEVFGPSCDTRVRDGCRRLAELVETPLLGVNFLVDAEGSWNFVGASTSPDLRIGGDALLDALTVRLTTQPEVAQ